MNESHPRRILWRCRRGTKELDIVLTGFLARGYSRLEAEERALFEELLDMEDTCLIEWLLYRQPPTQRFEALVQRILDCSPDT